jgi:hypothetical protein
LSLNDFVRHARENGCIGIAGQLPSKVGSFP